VTTLGVVEALIFDLPAAFGHAELRACKQRRENAPFAWHEWGAWFSMPPIAFQSGSLALSASIIRVDKEASFSPFSAIEEPRASHKAKQKALMCVLEYMLGTSLPIVYHSFTPGR
jgi:hypothetical protein